MSMKSSFPSRLAEMRKRRGLSQLQLASTADCSQRHISFLELGRTRPSREMVRRLSESLGLSLRQSNDLLLAAGFAPIWSETAYGAEPLAPIRQALEFMLKQQEPYPAVVSFRDRNYRGIGSWKEVRAPAARCGATHDRTIRISNVVGQRGDRSEFVVREGHNPKVQ